MMEALKNLSMPVKISIGVGILTLLGLLAWFLYKREFFSWGGNKPTCPDGAKPSEDCIAEAYRASTQDMRVFLEGLIKGPDINKIQKKDVDDLKRIAVDLNQKEASPQRTIAPAIQSKVKSNKDLKDILSQQANGFKSNIEKKFKDAVASYEASQN